MGTAGSAVVGRYERRHAAHAPFSAFVAGCGPRQRWRPRPESRILRRGHDQPGCVKQYRGMLTDDDYDCDDPAAALGYRLCATVVIWVVGVTGRADGVSAAIESSTTGSPDLRSCNGVGGSLEKPREEEEVRNHAQRSQRYRARREEDGGTEGYMICCSAKNAAAWDVLGLPSGGLSFHPPSPPLPATSTPPLDHSRHINPSRPSQTLLSTSPTCRTTAAGMSCADGVVLPPT